jgi:hypothetical protein
MWLLTIFSLKLFLFVHTETYIQVCIKKELSTAGLKRLKITV